MFNTDRVYVCSHFGICSYKNLGKIRDVGKIKKGLEECFGNDCCSVAFDDASPMRGETALAAPYTNPGHQYQFQPVSLNSV